MLWITTVVCFLLGFVGVLLISYFYSCIKKVFLFFRTKKINRDESMLKSESETQTGQYSEKKNYRITDRLLIIVSVFCVALSFKLFHSAYVLDKNENINIHKKEISTVVTASADETSVPVTVFVEEHEAKTSPIKESTIETTITPVTEPTTESIAQFIANQDTDQNQDYILNINSNKFHHPNCSSADRIKTSNRREYHGTREELISRNFEPCGRCRP